MTTENNGALVDTENADRVTFSINPASFTDSKSTEFAEIQIPGMSHPRLQFTGGNSRTVSFTLFLHHGATNDVPKAIRSLQAWLYPEYSGGQLKKAPHKLLLVFGDTWPDEQWVMTSCEITRQRFTKELECNFAQADIELAEFIDTSRNYDEVKS